MQALRKKYRNHELVKRRVEIEYILKDQDTKLTVSDRAILEVELSDILKEIQRRNIVVTRKLITAWWNKHGVGLGRLQWMRRSDWPEGAIAAVRSPQNITRYYNSEDAILRDL